MQRQAAAPVSSGLIAFSAVEGLLAAGIVVASVAANTATGSYCGVNVAYLPAVVVLIVALIMPCCMCTQGGANLACVCVKHGFSAVLAVACLLASALAIYCERFPDDCAFEFECHRLPPSSTRRLLNGLSILLSALLFIAAIVAACYAWRRSKQLAKPAALPVVYGAAPPQYALQAAPPPYVAQQHAAPPPAAPAASASASGDGSSKSSCKSLTGTTASGKDEPRPTIAIGGGSSGVPPININIENVNTATAATDVQGGGGGKQESSSSSSANAPYPTGRDLMPTPEAPVYAAEQPQPTPPPQPQVAGADKTVIVELH